jgi:hypothetical protein
MKTIIAGSRKFNNREAVFAAVTESGFVITEVVSGTAKGVDRLGEHWAKQNGVPIKQFPAISLGTNKVGNFCSTGRKSKRRANGAGSDDYR